LKQVVHYNIVRQRRGRELIGCCIFPSEHYRGYPKTRILAEKNEEVTTPYLDYNQSNGYLLPSYLEKLIPVGHVARVVNKVVQIC